MFGNFFGTSESLLAVDIGATSVKLVELALEDGDKPELVNLAVAPLPAEAFSNNDIAKPELIAEQIGALLEANGIEGKRVVTVVPAPSVFTKRIKMAKMPLADLAEAVQMEAGNFIPHNLEAVKLDFQVTGAFGKNQLDVLVVAVKNEVIDTLVDTISLAGLETVIVDVDYFALHNIFEHSYPELMKKTVALVNVGHRYSAISICRDQESMFTGDIGVGGRIVSEMLVQEGGVPADKVEETKRALLRGQVTGADPELVTQTVRNAVESMAAEYNRQLSFFWNASGADDGIEQILLAGGGATTPGLAEAIKSQTGIECATVEPFRQIDCGEGFDEAHLREIGPQVAVGVGLALRMPGDKAEEHAELEEA